MPLSGGGAQKTLLLHTGQSGESVDLLNLWRLCNRGTRKEDGDEGFYWLMMLRGQRAKRQLKYEASSSSFVQWRQEVQSLRERTWGGTFKILMLWSRCVRSAAVTWVATGYSTTFTCNRLFVCCIVVDCSRQRLHSGMNQIHATTEDTCCN